MPLSARQVEILRYLGDHKTATARNVTRELRMPRSAVRNALLELADKGLVSVDHGTFPASWSVTDIGAALLAAAHFDQET